MRTKLLPVCQFVLLFSVGVPVLALAAGKTYVWKDALGRSHYSDVPAANSQEIEVKPASGTRDAKSRDAQSAKDTKQQNCQSKRDQLNTYISAATVTETDSHGKTKTYTAAEKQDLIVRTRALVHDACDGK